MEWTNYKIQYEDVERGTAMVSSGDRNWTVYLVSGFKSCSAGVGYMLRVAKKVLRDL